MSKSQEWLEVQGVGKSTTIFQVTLAHPRISKLQKEKGPLD